MNENTVEVEIVEENKEVVLSEIKYPVSQVDLNNLLLDYKDIPDINPDADDVIVSEQYQFVLKGHKAFVKARTGIEKTRKQLKQPALDYGKRVDGIAKEFQSLIKSTEDKLFLQRKTVEDNEARKQREAEEAEDARVNNINSAINSLKQLPMECINKSSEAISDVLKSIEAPNKEFYSEFYDEALEVFGASSSQVRQMLENQYLVENAEKIQAEKDAEAKRIQDEEDAKHRAEKDALAKQQAEFQKQKDDFERQQREQQEIINRQKAEIEADELAKQQEAERVEKEAIRKKQFEEQEIIKKEQEAIRLKQIEEQKTIEAQRIAEQNAQDEEYKKSVRLQLLEELKELKTMTKIADAIISGVITNVRWIA